MRALTFTKYGKTSEVLRVDDVPAPTKADVPAGFVLIKVRAASLNPVDKMRIEGKLATTPELRGFPAVVGYDVAGTVDDAALGTALGAALGTTITVTSTAPQQVSTTRMVSATCPRGFWCTAGLTVECEAGFYNPELNANNQSACVKCPEHATTLGPNSTQKSACVCNTGYYKTIDGPWCALCPVGTNCSNPGVTLDALPIKPGYYRRSNATVDVRICGDASANCPAGTTECAESDSGCVGGDDPAAPCCPELMGIFCLLCTNTRVSAWSINK